VIILVQTTANTFHGSFGGQSLADFGIITDGTFRGKHLSFLGHDPPGVVERYDTGLVSMEPPTVKGYHLHFGAGACNFIATKM
jgi:hypothetical protein